MLSDSPAVIFLTVGGCSNSFLDPFTFFLMLYSTVVVEAEELC